MNWFDDIDDDIISTDIMNGEETFDDGDDTWLSNVEFNDNGELIFTNKNSVQKNNSYQCIDCGNDLEKIDEDYTCKVCGKSTS